MCDFSFFQDNRKFKLIIKHIHTCHLNLNPIIGGPRHKATKFKQLTTIKVAAYDTMTMILYVLIKSHRA